MHGFAFVGSFAARVASVFRSPNAVRIELTSENDLFFHYSHTLDEVSFRQVQEQQKLMVEFPE